MARARLRHRCGQRVRLDEVRRAQRERDGADRGDREDDVPLKMFG
jgi:hypothetical protein